MANGGTVDKGIVQLAQRTGLYRYINADCVYEGEKVTTDRMSGLVEITGEPTGDKVIGYFAYFELLNGFKKATYWTKEKVDQHARKYSKAYGKAGTPWANQFDAMAIKTVLKSILTKYGIMSIEFSEAVAKDTTVDEQVETEVAANANKEPVTIPAEIVDEEPKREPQDAKKVTTELIEEQTSFDDFGEAGF